MPGEMRPIKLLPTNIPWKEYAKPEDIANAVTFLAFDKSRYIAGEIIDVNGGLVMDKEDRNLLRRN